MKNVSNIRPGSLVDLVVAPDPYSERIDVRKGKVMDVETGAIIVSQTEPPLLPSHIGKTVALTYTVREEGRKARYGISATFKEIIKNYPLNPSTTIDVTVFQQTSPIERYNLRMHYRLPITNECGIEMSIHKNNVNLIDLSIGGAKFIITGKEFPELNSSIKGFIKFDKTTIPFKGKIIRVNRTDSSPTRPLQEAAVRFSKLDKRSEDLLGKKIREIERKTRYEETFPEDDRARNKYV